jgi:hypothetical protein
MGQAAGQTIKPRKQQLFDNGMCECGCLSNKTLKYNPKIYDNIYRGEFV